MRSAKSLAVISIIFAASALAFLSSYSHADNIQNVSILYGYNGTNFVPVLTNGSGVLQADMNITTSLGINPKANNTVSLGSSLSLWANFFVRSLRSSSPALSLYSGSTEAITILTNGSVGIGTTTPNAQLTIAGNLTFTNGPRITDDNGRLKLWAGGAVNGSGNTSSIYFLDSTGTVRGRYDTNFSSGMTLPSLSFSDTTNTDFSAGTLTNFTTEGTGATANITSTQNTSGVFVSSVINAVSSANWTSITIGSEVPYGTEIGRAQNDTGAVATFPTTPFINTTGLVLLYHFNNESNLGENGTIIRDFSIDANPGHTPHNGTTFNGAGYNTDAAFGASSMRFDGIDDFVNMSDLSYVTGNIARSVSAWIKISDLTARQMIFAYGIDSQFRKFEFEAGTPYLGSAGNIGLHRNDGVFATNTNSLQKDTWMHVVITYDGSTTPGGLRFYINGVNQSFTQTHGTTGEQTLNTADSGYQIGSRVESGTRQLYFNGSIDEISVWNRTLSPNEIRNLYLRGAFRFNLTVNSCSASDCSSGTSIQVSNSTNQSTITLTGLPSNQYFQYTINYTNMTIINTTNNDKIRINNVSVGGNLITGYGTLYVGSTNTAAADLAEYYATGDSSIEAGDMVALSNEKINGELVIRGVLRKAVSSDKIIGVISTSPGLILGSIDSNGHRDDRLLALAGRTPVKVIGENGAIDIGDYLTASSQPGVAMKSTQPGVVIGRALENFDGSGIGKIDVFVSVGENSAGYFEEQKSRIDEMLEQGKNILERLSALEKMVK